MKHHNIIILVIIILLLIRHSLHISFQKNDQVQRYIITTLKQYTFWNLCLIFINIFYTDEAFELFIFINTTVIFITYYMIHFIYRDRIKIFPNLPPELSETNIEILMFLIHGVPFIYYLYKFANMQKMNRLSYNIGYETALFNIIWSVLCFYSFDPRPAYFHIDDSVLYLIGLLMVSLHLSIGYFVQIKK